MSLARISLAVLLLFTSAACSSTPSDTAGTAKDSDGPTPTQNGSPSPLKDQEFETLEELRDAAVSAGYLCASWVQDDALRFAAESGSCTNSDVFSTYYSDPLMNMQLEEQADLAYQQKLQVPPQLIGPNWIIQTADTTSLDLLQGTLGGQRKN